jgi:hypothetical protein
MVRDQIIDFFFDLSPHAPKEYVTGIANRELDTAADVKLLLIDDALVGSNYGPCISLLFAQVRVTIWKVRGKTEGKPKVLLSAMRTNKRAASH